MALRRAIAVGGVAAVLAVWFQPVQAFAATSADLDVYVLAAAGGADPSTAAVGADALFQVFVSNFGPSASTAHVAITVTGATITSAADEQYSAGAACSVTSSTSATCTTDALDDQNGDSIIDLHTTAAHAGTITATADVSGPDTDPNPDDNSGNAQIVAVVPPAASITSTLSYSNSNGFETLDIAVHLARNDNSTGIAYNEIDVAIRYAGSSTWHDNEVTYTDGDGNVDVDLEDLSSGDFDVQLTHAATAQAAAASKIVHVVAPSTSLSVAVKPTAVSRGAGVKVTGKLTLTGTGDPVDGALLTLQRRATGSSVWHKATSGYTDTKGQLTLSDSPAQPSDYRLVHDSEIGAGASTSSVVSVAMAPGLRETASPAIAPPGYHAVLSAQAAPHAVGGVAHLQQLKRGSWTTIRTKPVPSSGLVTWTIPGPKKGIFTYRVELAPGLPYLAKVGKPLTVTVTTHGLGKRSAYSFLQMYNGHPMRWNPCRAIGYKINAKFGPPGAAAMVKETLRRIHLAAGLRFHYEGRTKTHPRWFVIHHQAAPLVVAWVTAKHSNGMFGFGGEVGFGGATESIDRDGHDVIEQGGVILLANSDPRTSGIAPGFGSGVTWGQLLMHELGHAMGLDHTNGKYQIMRPILEPLPAAMYGAGDLHGLHLLGRSQGCLS
jgi:Tfp pilus assembly protein PilV